MSFIVRSNTALPKAKAWTVNQKIESPQNRQIARIPTRRSEISWLDGEGNVQSKSAVIPAMPVFTEAMSAFAQGTLIQTPEGYVAIEDLEPGMQVSTGEGATETIQWIGSMALMPGIDEMNMPSSMLYRVTEGGYGLDADKPDLMMGPAARILPGLMATNSSSPLRDICDLADGYSVLEIRPVSTVRVFHIALGSHRLLRCNGVLAESYHPGSNVRLHLSTEMYGIFMDLFPHVTSDSDFGPMCHRRKT